MQYKKILELIERKDMQALELLFTQYANKFYSFSISNWNITEDEAYDLIYATFNTIINKGLNYSFENQSKFDAFIFTVFKNNFKQLYRAKQSRVYQELSIETFSDLEYKPYNEDNIENNPQNEKLQKILNEMNEKDKDILLLRANNFSYEEIVSMMPNENINALKTRHNRALEKLRTKFFNE